jgi:hypothetical protein
MRIGVGIEEKMGPRKRRGWPKGKKRGKRKGAGAE